MSLSFKNYILVFVSILVVITGVFYVYSPQSQVVDKTLNTKFSFVKDSKSFTSDQSTIQIDQSIPYETQIKYNLDPLRVNYTLIYNTYTIQGVTSSNIGVVKTSRESIFSSNWVIDEVKTGLIKNKSFSEAVALAQKYDLSKDNPDPGNIKVYEPPTKEQTETLKQSRDIKSNPEYQAREQECSSNLRKVDKELKDANDPDYIDKINAQLLVYRDCLNKLNREYGLIEEIY